MCDGQKLLDEASYFPNPVLDSSLFKSGYLSVETHGHLFVKRYGQPVDVNLDYSAMPLYCKILELEADIKRVSIASRIRLTETWGERQQTLIELEDIWNSVQDGNILDFENNAEVAEKVSKLSDLTSALWLSFVDGGGI